MKKTLCIATLVVLNFINAKAQNKLKQLGLNVGYINSTAKYNIFSNGQTINYESGSVSGFTIGVNYQVPVADNFTITPEFSFIKKGSLQTITDNSIPASETGKIKTNHICLALNVSYHFNKEKGLFVGVAPMLTYGIGGSFSLNSKGMGEDTTVFGSIKFDGTYPDNSTELTLHFKPLEFCGSIFLGYKFSENINIKVMYCLGLTNQAASYPESFETTAKYKCNYWGVGLTYSFGK